MFWEGREVELLTTRPKRNKMKVQFFGEKKAHWRTEERELERERIKSIKITQTTGQIPKART